MTTPVLPDAELITIEYLRQHAAVSAIVAARVYTQIPSTPTWPMLRVQRLGGPSVARSTLDAASTQFEAYADTRFAAGELARTAVAALGDAAGFAGTGGFITETEVLAGLRWIPDPDLEHKPRFIFDHTVYVRSS